LGEKAKAVHHEDTKGTKATKKFFYLEEMKGSKDLEGEGSG
jgi:hypothetical protein